MDEKDRKIVKILQRNAREQLTAIAQEVHLSVAAIHARLIKLERSGTVAGYEAIVDPKAVGNEIEALIRVTVSHPQDDPEQTLERIVKLKGVIDACTTTGEWDYQVHVFVKGVAELRALTAKLVKTAVPHMIRSDTALVMYARRKPLDV